MLAKNNANDFFMEVVKGNVSNMSAIQLYGKNGDVDAGTEDVCTAAGVSGGDGVVGSVTLASTAGALYISSSAADTTQYVTVTGLDANGVVRTATKKLAGQTKTALTSLYTFLRVISVTLDVVATGTVFVYYDDTIAAGVPDHKAKIAAAVAINDLSAKSIAYAVPANKNAYIYNVNYNSYNATTATGTILTLKYKTFAASSWTDIVFARYSDPGSGQYSFPVPLKIPAGYDFKVTATLAATGSNQIVECTADVVLEDIEVATTTTDIMTKKDYASYLTDNSRTISSTKLYLIGLDAFPAALPTTFIVDDKLAEITGTTSYRPAAETQVAFKSDYYAGSGILITTTKKAILTLLRCVDSAAVVKYVYYPVNTVYDLTKTNKVTYTA